MKISRRTFLRNAATATVASAAGCITMPDRDDSMVVNDVHTQLNPTRVHRVTPVRSMQEARNVLRRARRERRSISIAGGRHAAGGQQFATDVELIDTRLMSRVLHFDSAAGTIEVETGIQWPRLMGFLRQARVSGKPAWTVAQKQTGTDRLSIGGALAANAHGRGLTLPPFITHVESFTLIDTDGDVHLCSREHNPDLFSLAIGGYGLFGFIYSATLRLVPARKVRRVVQLLEVPELPGAFANRIRDGYLFGDFQFAIDPKSDAFLRRGIFACYEPIADSAPLPAERRKLTADEWKMLIYLAHTNPTAAFERYAEHYLATSGQLYESDTQYVSDYFDHYHGELDTRMGATVPATEVIGELNVPRDSLPQFLAAAKEELRRDDAAPLIYGTIRVIEKDDESFLCWARQDYACVIFNLHTPHTQEGKERTARTFRKLIDLAIGRGGSFYLTYHRYATREQVISCYPQFQAFLQQKLRYDPEELFQSNWYRHYKQVFA